MNGEDFDFPLLMRRVRNGDPEAALELLDRYSPHVLRLIRRRLKGSLRKKFDSADFVQAVWVDFFADEMRRDFEHPEELLRFLIALARNKLCDELRRRMQSERYNVTREQSLEELGLEWDMEIEAIDWRQPRPSQVAVARERWSKLLADQPPLHRRILELRCKGSTFLEIAAVLKVHERTARRVFERLTLELAKFS